MLATWLLALALQAHATPPPLPSAGPPRIEGLQVTYVTPDTFVGALQPAGANPHATFQLLTLSDDAPVTADELATSLEGLDGVHAVVADGQVRVDLGDSGLQLPAHEIPVGDGTRRVDSLATLLTVPRPIVRMPNGVPVPPPMVTSTGFDLVLHNPITTGEVVVEVQGARIGTMHPDGVATLRDVRPGLYEVVFHVDTGHAETMAVAAVRREPAPPDAP